MNLLASFTALSYSVLNVFKRLVIIIGSVLYFGNMVAPLNQLGILIASAGVLYYSKLKVDHQNKWTHFDIKSSEGLRKNMEMWTVTALLLGFLSLVSSRPSVTPMAAPDAVKIDYLLKYAPRTVLHSEEVCFVEISSDF